MKLKDVELIPGVVINNSDPTVSGRIKAEVPGIFNSSTMSMESLPWIYPFTSSGHQRFSKPELGDKVWVFVNPKNYHEYWYMNLPEHHGDSKSIKSKYDGTEVIFSRASGTDNADMYYTNSTGIVANCTGNKLQLKPNGNVQLVGCDNGKGVRIQDGRTYLGSADGDAHQPAVYGDNLYKLLSELGRALQEASLAASTFWATTNLSTPLNKCAKAITDNIENIRVNNTYVD